MAYTITWEAKGAYKRFSGHVTAQEFLSSVNDFQSTTDFDLMEYSINDLLGVEAHSVTPDDVLQYAALGIGSAAFNARVKVAIVTNQPEIAELIRQYQQMVRYELRFFDRLEDARVWVATGLP